ITVKAISNSLCCHRLQFHYTLKLPPPRPTLFPYTTLFRSPGFDPGEGDARRDQRRPPNGLRHVQAEARGMIGPVHHTSCLGLYVDRKSTRLNSSHGSISYAVFCLKKKKL